MIRIFSHHLSVNVLFLVGLETVVLLFSVYLGASIGLVSPGPTAIAKVPPNLSQALVFAFCILTSMTALGLYQQQRNESIQATLARLSVAFVLGLAAVSLMFYLVPSLYLGHSARAITVGVALAGIVFTRVALLRWVMTKVSQTRVLVLGTGSRAASVGELVRQKRAGDNFTVVGYLPLQATRCHLEAEHVLPAGESITTAVRKYHIDEIVIAVRDRRGGGLPVQELLECKLRGVKITELAAFFERQRRQLHLGSLNTSWMVFSEGFRQGFARKTVKRLFDVVASAALLIATLPIMLITALCIAIASGAPILYCQKRVGEQGRIFTIFKFRSMRNDAESDGKPRWANANDDRVTRVGRVMRKLRIDELPQIFNVLKGDMSFVGPRPERPFFVEQLASKIPYYKARHSIKPGITGWAQVSYSYGASLADAIEKLQYDLYYVKNHTLFLDTMILIHTIQVVLRSRGVR